MHSSLIGKIEKAKRYAEEPDRVAISNFSAAFRGENDSHDLEFAGGKWHCDCRFFERHGECVHIMTMQRLLGKMIPVQSGNTDDI